MPTYRRILVAVDLTEDSVKVAERGRMLAAALGSELELIHVLEPLPVAAPIPPEPVLPTLIETQEKQLEAAQKRLARLAANLELPQARWSVEVGAIKAEIVRVAREHRVDLIVLVAAVISSRSLAGAGRTAPLNLSYGDVSQSDPCER